MVHIYAIVALEAFDGVNVKSRADLVLLPIMATDHLSYLGSLGYSKKPANLRPKRSISPLELNCLL